MTRPPIIPIAILAVLCALLLSFTPLTASGQSATSSLLVKLAVGLSPAQQAQVIARNGGIEVSSIPALRLHVIEVLTADLPQALANYQADAQVVSAEENKTRQSQAFPADPLYQNQWSLPKIGWDLVFGNVTPTGSAVVAVLDTGVDAQHPDLAANVMPGISILDGSAGTTDPSGHGTWIAGIVAAQTDTLEGIAGVAYSGVRIMPVTVLDANGLGQDSDIIAGVIWAADHGADVIVMAFSSPGFSQNLQDAIDYAWSKNVILVAATGNGGLNTPTFPAGDRGVMGVSGTDANDTLVPFSNYGPSVFIAAPGTYIQTTDIGDAYTVINGTSASAAIVAGAAAFMKAVDPTLTNGIIVGRLARMADPAGTQDQSGNGRINFARALADTSTDFIQPAGAPPTGNGGPFVGPYVAATLHTSVSPPSVVAGSTGNTLTFTFTSQGNSGSGTSTITVPSGGWTAPVSHVSVANVGCASVALGTVSGNSIPVNYSGCPNLNGNTAFTVSYTSVTAPTVAQNYTFAVTGGGDSVVVGVSAGPAAKVVFTTQPGNGTGGSNLSTQPAVTVQDTFGNTVTSPAVSVTLAIGSNPSGGTLSVTTNPVTTTNGVASFAGVKIDKAGNGYTLTASAPGLVGATSNTFNVAVGAPAKLVFVQQPTNTQAGSAISPAVTVQIQDAGGNPTTATTSVTVAIGANPGGGTLSGTATVAAAGGIATFSNLSINKTGTAYTLTASATGLTGTTSSAFNITPGPASKLAFAQQPTNTAAGASITPAVTVQVQDANGNVVSDSRDVTLAIGTNPGSGTLSGTTTVAAVNGTATFSNLSINKAGNGYTLTASSSPAMTTATSSAFNITAGAATKLVFGVQPSTAQVGSTISPAVTIQIQDANDNIVTTSTANVTMTIGTNPGGGTLSGTTSVAAAAGIATFGNLSISSASTGYTLAATSAGLTSATSNAFDITAVTTTISVTSSLNPSNFGQSVTFTASITGQIGSTRPTGTVTFFDGVTVLGTAGTQGNSGSAQFSISTLAAGSHSITAQYSGNASFAPSTSPAITQTVNNPATSTSVVSSVNPSVFGQSVTFTATVTPASGTGTPTGTMTFMDGAITLGTGALSGGQAALTTSSLSTGSHSITAVYGGDSTFTGSTSGALSQVVNKGATTTSVASSVNPSGSGQSVTFTATVSPVAPAAGTLTGTVTFMDGATMLGTGALSGGQATFSTSTLSVGSHSITAVYSGDSSFNTSTSAALTQTVNKGGTTTSVLSSANPSSFGQSVTFTATISPAPPALGTPTGTVTFMDGAATLGTGTLSGGQATFSTTALTVGSHSITAVYGGDANFEGSASGTLTQTVNKADTTTVVISDVNPTVFGQSVTFTATVSVSGAGSGTPTGTVTFYDGATALGTGTLSAGQATFSTSTLTVGSRSITAAYGGDTSFSTSASAVLTQTVNAANTTTTLVSNTSPAKVGQTVTFTATVTVNSPGAGTTTGTVTFKDGATVLGTGTLSAAGQATYTTSSLTSGSHSITAEYGGDGSFNASASNTVTQVVDAPPVATADYYITFVDTPLTIGAPGVLGNDNDSDTGDTTSVYAPITSDTMTALGGTLHYLHADGSFSYTPPAGITGIDTFTYQATDGVFPSDPAVTVYIEVRAANATPVAENDAYRIAHDTPLAIPAPGVLDNDQRTLGNELKAVLNSSTSHGALVLNDDGSFTYTPAAGFTGRDSFTYHVYDVTANRDSNVAMVTITVQADGASPVADNDLYTVAQDGTLTVPLPGVLGNDAPPTGLTAELVSGPLYGTLALNGTGNFTYTPALGFAGRDSFIYRAKANTTGAYSNQAMARILVSATTTTTVSSDHAPSVFGQPVTFTATISPAAATGSVQFQVDGSSFGSPVTVSGGTATIGPISTLSVADHVIKAFYTSDSEDFLDSTSANFTQTVNKADSLSTVASSVNPSVFGESVTFTATVTAVSPGAGTPTGTVTFKDGATTLGAQTLSSGQATFTTSALSVATHAITATYSGEGNFNATGVGGSTAPALSQVVSKADSLSTVTSSVNPSVFGQSVTFTATVTAVAPGAGTPTGTVTFKDGATTLSTQTLSGGTATFTTSALSVGAHSITASYSGDSGFNATGVGASTAPALSQVVNKADSLSTVTSSVNPSVFGQSVTFTATVTAVAPGAGTPTGTVTFKDGSTTLSTQTLSGGTATFTTSALSVGAHSITASYSGDTSFNGTGVGASTAPALSQVVNKADSLSTVTSSVNPSVFGQPVTFTATVTAVAPGAGTPSGSVTFMDGATTLATVALNSYGKATFTTSALTVATHSITATYSGDANFNATGTGGSTAPAFSQTVNKADSLSTVTSSVSPSVFGQSVTFTATVTAVAPGTGTPSGSVTFMDGATTLGSGTLDASGKATYTTAALSVATHSISATYSGEANFNATGTGGSTAPAFSQTVNRANSLSTVGSSVNPSVFGQSVTFTATVTAVAPGAGTPSGTVTFKDGSTTLSTQTLSGGVATFTTSALSVGSHSVTATYSGDSNFNATGMGGSTAPALNQVVNKANSLSSVSSSVNPSVFGQPVTFTATVTAVAPGAGTPSGSVTFVDGSTTLGTVALNSYGKATFTTSVLTVGTHSITATYSGDGNFNPTGTGGSTAPAFSQTVNKADSLSTVTSSANPSVFGQSVTFTATVTAVAPGTGTPTGSVTFVDGATTLGSGTLDASGKATYTTSALSVAMHSITATYSGDGNFNPTGTGGSTAPALTQTVNKAATSTSLASSANPSTLAQSVTFTTTVTAVAPGAGIPTGTVTFYDGATLLGTATLSAGNASFSTAALGLGSHSISATYGSDGNFTGSTSTPALTQAVYYGFIGLLSPYAPPSDRAFKVKSAIPLKWQYTNFAGAVIPSANAAPTVSIGTASCAGLDGTQDIVVEDAGASGYQYDATTNTWQFNWKTTGLSAGCYNIRVNSAQTGQTSAPFLIQLVR